MDVEFDSAKDASNIARRGLSLELGAVVIDSAIGSIVDERFAYGETRALAYGLISGRLHVCVYTLRGSVYRIISVRKANRKEQAQWLS